MELSQRVFSRNLSTVFFPFLKIRIGRRKGSPWWCRLAVYRLVGSIKLIITGRRLRWQHLFRIQIGVDFIFSGA
jgi:hypothetical protein